MNERRRRQLMFHGAAAITLGMLSGIPLAMVLLGELSGNPSDWKLAHMEGLINGLLVIGVAAGAGLLSLSEGQQKVVYFCLPFTAYSNAFYGIVRGFSGERGMSLDPPFANQLAAVLGGLPIFTAFIAIALVMYGALRASRP